MIFSLCFLCNYIAGNLNVMAFIGGVFFILISIGIFTTVVCYAGRKRRQRLNSQHDSDKKRGKQFCKCNELL